MNKIKYSGSLTVRLSFQNAEKRNIEIIAEILMHIVKMSDQIKKGWLSAL